MRSFLHQAVVGVNRPSLRTRIKSRQPLMCSQAPAVGWNAAQPLALIGRQSLLGSKPMHVHIVMDRQGDTRYAYDRANARSLADAERRFRELTGKGFRSVALCKDGQP